MRYFSEIKICYSPIFFNVREGQTKKHPNIFRNYNISIDFAINLSRILYRFPCPSVKGACREKLHIIYEGHEGDLAIRRVAVPRHDLRGYLAILHYFNNSIKYDHLGTLHYKRSTKIVRYTSN